MTPSRRKRNQARRDQWLAKKREKSMDIPVEMVNQDEPILEDTTMEDTVEAEVDEIAPSTNSSTKDLKILSENKSKQVIETIEESVIKRPFFSKSSSYASTEGRELSARVLIK